MNQRQPNSLRNTGLLVGASLSAAAMLINHMSHAEANSSRKQEVQALLDSKIEHETVILSEGVALRSTPQMINEKGDGSTNVVKHVAKGKKLALVNPLEFTDVNNDVWLGATTPGAKPTDIESRAANTVWINYSQLDGQNKIEEVPHGKSASDIIKITGDGVIEDAATGAPIEKAAQSVEFSSDALQQLIDAGLAAPAQQQ